MSPHIPELLTWHVIDYESHLDREKQFSIVNSLMPYKTGALSDALELHISP